MSDKVMEALAILSAVKPGDVAGYRSALSEVARLVPCGMQQLALVDTILEARTRAYKEAA